MRMWARRGASWRGLRKRFSPSRDAADAPRRRSFGELDVLARHQVVDDDEADDRQRRRQERADRSPHPGPERQRQEDEQRVERDAPADDSGRNEMTFHRGEEDKGKRRDERLA